MGDAALEETNKRHRLSRLGEYHMDDVDKQILRFKLNYPKMRIAVLAKEVGLSTRQIRRRMEKPAFTKAVQEFNESALDQLKGVQAEAMRTIKTLLRSQNEHIRLAAAKTVLAGLLEHQGQGPEATITYKVRFGDGGAMFREVMNEAPSTIDLLKE